MLHAIIKSEPDGGVIFKKSFAENLRHARTERGLSQEQLAKLISTKSSSEYGVQR